MIEADKVCLRYPDGTLALKDVNLKIEKGDVVFITGPSGSGKTSLLKLFLGMEYPTEGRLSVLGQTISKNRPCSDIRKLRRDIGPVFQEFKLIKGRTALENVMIGMRFLNFSLSEIKQNASIALEKVGLFNKAESLVDNLSWGECQRVAIARAVARKPKLILADEPTGNLDKDNAIKILDLFYNLKDENTAVVITTHATHLIDPKKCDMLLSLNSGRISLERLR